MKFKFPFASEKKALEHHLSQEIKKLQDQLEENDLDSELRDLEFKNYTSTEINTPTAGLAGVVDEFYDKAMLQKLYSTETWFYIAVHTIAKTIASLPLKLEKKKKITQSVLQSDGSTDKIQKETWIDASGEPEFEILNRPNALQSSVEFWLLILIDLMATGDAYIFADQGDPDETELQDERTPEGRLRRAISKVRKSKVRGLYRLSAGMVKPVPSQEDNKVLGGYQINTEYGIFTFETEDVIHIRLPNPADPFFGLAPIIPVMKNLLLDKYSAEHMIRFYKQGARLGGVINTEKKLTKDQLVRLERVFESNFTGKRNHHKTLILPEGMKYQTIEQNPGETSLIEFLKANKEPILAAYNMPPVKVGLLDGATFANAMIQEKTYYNDTIKPICRIVEEAINQHGAIIPRLRELKFSFSFDQIEALKEDELNKANTATAMLNSGMSINEVREKVWKLSPTEDGDLVPAVEKTKQPASPFLFQEPVEPLIEVPVEGEGDSEEEESGNPNGVQHVKPKEVLNGAQITSMVTLLQSIDLGTITRESALGILEIGFNLTREQAEKIVGNSKEDTSNDDQNEQKSETSNTQNDTSTLSDVKPTGGTFETRVAELVAQAVASGISAELAVPKAIGQALTEGFSPTLTPKEEEKKTQFSKDYLIQYQKQTTGEGVAHLIQDRLVETHLFFQRMEKAFIKVLNRKKKSIVLKARQDKGLIEMEDLQFFLDEEMERLYESDEKALRHGYTSSISSRPMTFPNTYAHEMLKLYGAKKIKSIVDTTNRQLAKAIIEDSFEEQVSPQEIASRLKQVMPQITAGRAMTIARTETLSAVSMGQDLKAQEFKKAFPKEAGKLKRVWVSAEDELVRDSHVIYNGMEVLVGEEFAPGLKFPRDPDCPDASEVINCRCTSIEYLPEMEDRINSIMSDNTLLADAVEDVEE